MIQRQLKIRPNRTQEKLLEAWLWQSTGIYNWALRKIELNAKDGIYYTKLGFQNLLANHAKKIGMPSHLIQGILIQAYIAWERCFKKIAKKPRFKGVRNKLNSLPFPDPMRPPKENRITVPKLGKVKFHKQELPDGKIKTGRIIKRASGWYLALTIDAEPNIKNNFKPIGHKFVGIDPGFKDLLSLSNGEKVSSPLELNRSLERLGQAQRGGDKKLTARINERIANQKKDRNHKLSRKLVEQYQMIVFSKDNIKGIQKKFGKSVANANHYQLRQMLAYKSSSCGRDYKEVNGSYSTKTCSTCGTIQKNWPKGFAGLSVRNFKCEACGTHHDRDTNAAINTLISGAGSALKVA